MVLIKSWVNISTSKSHHPGDKTHDIFIITVATTPAVLNAQFFTVRTHSQLKVFLLK